VDIEHGQELLVRGLLNDVVPGVAGVVDDDLETAEAFDGRIYKALRKGGIGDVAGEGGGASAGLRDGGFGLGGWNGVQVIDHYGSAVFGKLFGNRAADAAAGARDQGSLLVESEGHETYSYSPAAETPLELDALDI